MSTGDRPEEPSNGRDSGHDQGAPYGQDLQLGAYSPTSGYAPTSGYPATGAYAADDPYSGSSPAYGPPGPYYAPAGVGPYPAATAQNWLGGWALGLGIASIFIGSFLILPIAAIIMGAMGREAANEGRASNRGMATAGMVLGIVTVVLYVLAIGIAVALAVGVWTSTS